MTTEEYINEERKRLIHALNNKRVITDPDGREYLSRMTKQEAEEEILNIYDELTFRFNQILNSTRALEQCCHEMRTKLGMEEEEFFAMYIENLHEESIKRENETIQKEEEKISEEEKERPKLSLIEGGLKVI